MTTQEAQAVIHQLTKLGFTVVAVDVAREVFVIRAIEAR